MATTENLVHFTKENAKEMGSKGGIRSGEVRREKASMKKALEMLLDEKNKKGQTYRDLATLGLIKGAIDGKAENYKVIVQLLGEMEESKETPNVEIKIVDNTGLEKVMYEKEEQ